MRDGVDVFVEESEIDPPPRPRQKFDGMADRVVLGIMSLAMALLICWMVWATINIHWLIGVPLLALLLFYLAADCSNGT